MIVIMDLDSFVCFNSVNIIHLNHLRLIKTSLPHFLVCHEVQDCCCLGLFLDLLIVDFVDWEGADDDVVGAVKWVQVESVHVGVVLENLLEEETMQKCTI